MILGFYGSIGGLVLAGSRRPKAAAFMDAQSSYAKNHNNIYLKFQQFIQNLYKWTDNINHN